MYGFDNVDTTIYYFEHTNHGNHQVFLVLIFQTLFEHVCSLYQ